MIGWLATKARIRSNRAVLSKNGVSWISANLARRRQLAPEARTGVKCELYGTNCVACSINLSGSRLREVTTRLEATRQHAEDKSRQMINSERRLKRAVLKIWRTVSLNSNRRVDSQNRQSLNSLLTPLREQLDGFRRRSGEFWQRSAGAAYAGARNSVICSSLTRKWRRKRST